MCEKLVGQRTHGQAPLGQLVLRAGGRQGAGLLPGSHAWPFRSRAGQAPLCRSRLRGALVSLETCMVPRPQLDELPLPASCSASP